MKPRSEAPAAHGRLAFWVTLAGVGLLVLAMGLVARRVLRQRATAPSVRAPAASVKSAAPSTSAVSGLRPLVFRSSLEAGGYGITSISTESPRISFVEGSPGQPAPGDIAEAAGMVFPLGAPRQYVFDASPIWAEPAEPYVYEVHPNGRRTIAGVNVWSADKAEALTRLGPGDLAGIRHVNVGELDGALVRSLAQLDPEISCLELWNIAEPNEDLAALEHVRCLRLDNSSLSLVVRLKDLRHLWIDGPEIDVRLIAQCRNLVSLHVRWVDRIQNLGALARLRELRVLDLPRSPGVRDLRFAQSLRELREIDVSGSRIQSLAPLEHLPNLREIRANLTQLTRLPRERMPSLRALQVMSAGEAPSCDECKPGPRLPAREVERFQERNPQTVIAHRYNEVLGRVMAKVTRVRIRTGGTCHRINGERTLLDIERREDIQVLAGLMAVEEPSESMACRCCGDPTFELYHAADLLASVGFHHGTTLRWPDGWPSDAAVVDGDGLLHWLAARGVRGPLEERRELEERRRTGPR